MWVEDCIKLFFVEHEVKKSTIKIFYKLGGVSQVKYSEKDFQINFFIGQKRALNHKEITVNIKLIVR